MDSLTKSGVSEEQARARAEALDAAPRATGAAKAGIAALMTGVAATKAEILKWMFAALPGRTVAIAVPVKLL